MSESKDDDVQEIFFAIGFCVAFVALMFVPGYMDIVLAVSRFLWPENSNVFFATKLIVHGFASAYVGSIIGVVLMYIVGWGLYPIARAMGVTETSEQAQGGPVPVAPTQRVEPERGKPAPDQLLTRALKGDIEAIERLAHAYETGSNARKDLQRVYRQRAYIWYARGCLMLDAGYAAKPETQASLRSGLERLTRQLGRSQLEQARDLVPEWEFGRSKGIVSGSPDRARRENAKSPAAGRNKGSPEAEASRVEEGDPAGKADAAGATAATPPEAGKKPPRHETDAAAALTRAGELLRRNRPQEALALVEPLARAPAADAAVLELRAACLNALGRHEEALAQYMRLVDRGDPTPGILRGCADTLLLLGREPEAIAWFDRAIAADPDDAEAWYGRASALDATGETGAARDSFARAAALGHRRAAAALRALERALGIPADATPRAPALRKPPPGIRDGLQP